MIYKIQYLAYNESINKSELRWNTICKETVLGCIGQEKSVSSGTKEKKMDLKFIFNDLKFIYLVILFSDSDY